MFSWPALTLAAHLQKSEWFRENYRGPYAKISPGCSLEGLMLKLKLQYFGHLMRRVGSLEKTLMLGGIGGRRRRGHLDGEMAIHSSYFHLGNPMDSGAWQAGSPWDHRESNTTQNTCRHLLSSSCWDKHWVPLDNPEFSLNVFKAGL